MLLLAIGIGVQPPAAFADLGSDLWAKNVGDTYSVDGYTFVILKKQTVDGKQAVMIMPRGDFFPQQSWSSTSNNYEGSDIQTELTKVYKSNNWLPSIKAITLVPDLGPVNSTSKDVETKPTGVLATSTTQTKDIYFLPSYGDLKAFNNNSIMNLRPEFKNYNEGRLMTRTAKESDTANVCEVIYKADTFSCSAHYLATIPSKQPTMWVLGEAITHSATINYVDTDGNPIKTATIQTVDHGNTLTITSPPLIPGYDYEGWKNGSSGAVNTGTVTIANVTGDISIYLVYHKKAYTAELSVNPASTTAGSFITATVIVKETNGSPIEGVTITFAKKSADITLTTTTCMTLATGCSVDVVSDVAKTYPDEISATATVLLENVAVTGSPATVTFTAGPLDYTRSSFSVEPVAKMEDKTTWVIVGNSYTGTLTASDSLGNPITDLALSDIVFSASSTAVDVSAVTNHGDGRYTVTYTSTKADSAPTAQVTYKAVQVGKTVPIPFRESKPVTCSDPDLATHITADPTNLLVGQTSKVTAHVSDEYCNPIPDWPVTFWLTSGSNGQLSETIQFTDANGNAAVALTDKTAETVKVNGSIPTENGDWTLPNSPVAVTFSTSTFSYTTSTFTVNPTAVLSDKSTWVQVSQPNEGGYLGILTAKDGFGNLLTDLNLDDIVFTASSSDVAISTVVNNHDGTYSVTYTSTKASSDPTAQVTYKSTQVGENLPIPFKAGTPTAICQDPKLGSSLTANPLSLPVGETSEATAYVTDEFCNPVEGVVVTFTLEPGSDAILVVLTSITDPAGKAYATLSDVTAETVQISAAFQATQGWVTIPGSPVSVEFTDNKVDPDKSTVTLDPDIQVVGSPVTVIITARDSKNNPITGIPVSQIQVSGINGTLLATVTNCIEVGPSKPGVYTCQMTAQLVGPYTVTAVVTAVTLNQHPVAQFTHGGVCTDNCTPVDSSHITRFEMVTNDQLANGKAKDSARAYAYDTYGNEVSGAHVIVIDVSTDLLAGYLNPATATATTGSDGTALVEWTSTKQGIFTGQGTIDGLSPVTGILNQIRFIAGKADPSHSDLVVSPASPIVVGNNYTLKVTVRDTTDNPLAGETVSFSVDSDNAIYSETTCQTVSDGTCSVTLTSKLVGSYQVSAAIPNSTGVATNVIGSPAIVEFTHGSVCVSSPTTPCDPVDPSHITRIEVDPNGQPADGKAQDVINVYAYDRYGNPVLNAQVDAVAATGVTLATPAKPVIQGNGQAIVGYTSTTKGEYKVDVTVGGLVPNGSPATLIFRSGTPDWSKSTLMITPTFPQVVESIFTVTAHVVDTNMNPVSGAVVVFPAVTNLAFDASTCTTDDNGNCSVKVTSIKANTYVISATGDGQPLANTVTATFTAGEICIPDDGCVPDAGEPISRIETVVNGVLPDGIQHDIFKVFAYDKHGNPVSGADVASTTTDARLITQSPIAATDSDGTSTIWYASLHGGTYTAAMTVGGKVPQGSPVHPVFGGIADPDHSFWSVYPTTPRTVGVDPDNTFTMTATLRDANDLPMVGAAMTFAIDPASGPTFPNGTSCLSDADGKCTVDVYSTKAGTYSISATSAGQPVKSQAGRWAESVVWISDEVCTEASGCVPVDPNLPQSLRTRVVVTEDYMVADGDARDLATVYAFDKWGNAVPGQLVQSSTTEKMTVQSGIAGTNSNGQSTIWYSSTVSGGHLAMVKVGGKIPASINSDGTSSGAGTITLNFIPGAPDADKSVLTVSPSIQRVGEDVSATAIIKDAYGNPISNTRVSFSSTGASTRTGDSCITDAAGSCQISLTDKVPETIQLNATVVINTAATPISGSPATVTFNDVTAPEPPVITSPKDGDLTNHSSVIVTGTGEPSAEVTVIDENGTSVCADVVIVGSDGTWTCEVLLPDGEHTLTATQKDSSGNTSDPSNSVTITVDTTPPDTPIVDSSNGSQVTGSGEPGSKVTIKDPDGNVIPGCEDVYADEDGHFVCIPTTVIPPDTELSVTVTDEAGNTSEPTTVVVGRLVIEFAYPTRNTSQTQIVTGANFNPYEKVCMEYSGGTERTCTTADKEGKVKFSFTVPGNLKAGVCVVTLIGERSGSVTGTFSVTSSFTGMNTPFVSTGGTAVPQGLHVGRLVAAAMVAAATMPLRRRRGPLM
jgi:adhesin/invasin